MSRPPLPPEIKRILVAADGSENADRAALRAIDLARRLNAHLVVVHVSSYPSQYYGIVRHDVAVAAEIGREDLDRLKKRASVSMKKISEIASEQKILTRIEYLESGPSIVDAIINYAETEGIDLIVVGTRGLNAYQSSLAGSVSTGLVNRAHCAVLVVR